MLVILGVQSGAFKEERSFYSHKKYQENLKIEEYHSINFWYIYVVERSISLFQFSTSMSESLFRVIVLPLLVYLYFEIDTEQDEVWNTLFVGVILIGGINKTGAFIRERRLIQFYSDSIEGAVVR